MTDDEYDDAIRCLTVIQGVGLIAMGVIFAVLSVAAAVIVSITLGTTATVVAAVIAGVITLRALRKIIDVLEAMPAKLRGERYCSACNRVISGEIAWTDREPYHVSCWQKIYGESNGTDEEDDWSAA